MNGLLQWNEQQLEFRDYLNRVIPYAVKDILLRENKAWMFKRIETPVLLPTRLISSNYTSEDVWKVEDSELTLRPETTPGTYDAMQQMLTHQEIMPPVCVWQVGKSFRREQDQPTKFMRLKEFNQMEFQCLYSEGTLNDYQEAVLEPLGHDISGVLKADTRIVDSDRLPAYSKRTVDIEVFDTVADRWMEVCSVSLRTDFPQKLSFTGKGGVAVTKDALVLEIAVGIDRLVYLNFKGDGTSG